ncbi:hypothetical protein ON010_g18885 [Phytophthora cinnamomi]|nr:hypothetical protein ON010_g18885 [Phytophthora cinnamomi]
MTDLRKFQGDISTRRAPPISQRVQDDLQQVFGRWNEELAGYYRKIGWVACSVIPTQLWIHRIRAVHENAIMNAYVQAAAIWSSVLRQLRAISRRDKSRRNIGLSGLYLQICTERFAGETTTVS